MLNFYHISVIQFFKSNWPEVRAAAAMFIGASLTPTINSLYVLGKTKKNKPVFMERRMLVVK